MRVGQEYKIVGIYIIVGFLWIIFSDAVTESLLKYKEEITLIQNFKGSFFVLFTGVLLFFLIRKSINELKDANTKLKNGYKQTIDGWMKVLDTRHKETKNHTARVTRMTLELAKISGITDPEELENIECGAILHDIGKIGISDEILIKPSKLTEDEFARIKTHPQIAYDIMSGIDFLSSIVDIPYSHHEKWDGSGYPKGLKGADIPVAARIFSIIDVWDALIHPRIYKSAWPEEKVLKYIQEQAGSHFDPHIVRLFLDNYEQIKTNSKAG